MSSDTMKHLKQLNSLPSGSPKKGVIFDGDASGAGVVSSSGPAKAKQAITRTDAGLLGDIDPSCTEVAGWLAPMPGGTGPMTRAMLLANAVDRAEILAS